MPSIHAPEYVFLKFYLQRQCGDNGSAWGTTCWKVLERVGVRRVGQGIIAILRLMRPFGYHLNIIDMIL